MLKKETVAGSRSQGFQGIDKLLRKKVFNSWNLVPENADLRWSLIAALSTKDLYSDISQLWWVN